MKPRVKVALVVSALLGASQAMAAADWEVLPFGSLGSYYESNLGLSPVAGDKLDVLGAEATAGVALRATSPVSTFILRPYARSTWFPSEQDSDYNNAYLDLDYKRRGQRSNLSLLGNFAHETVTSRALDVTTPQGDLGNPTDGDVSNAGTRSRRDLVGVYPMASFSLTQRNRLDLAINYVDVNYDRELPGQELGYGFQRGAVGWGFSISQLDSVTLTAAADKFDPDDLQGQPPSIGSRTNSLTARWMRSLNETQRWYVQAGANRTRFELAQGATDRITKSGYSGGAGRELEAREVAAVRGPRVSRAAQLLRRHFQPDRRTPAAGAQFHAALGGHYCSAVCAFPGGGQDHDHRLSRLRQFQCRRRVALVPQTVA